MKNIKHLLITSTVLTSFIIGIVVVHADWTPAPANPPSNNASTPINVNYQDQIKVGGLTLSNGSIIIGAGLLPGWVAAQTLWSIDNAKFSNGIDLGFPTLGRAENAGDINYIKNGNQSLDIYGGGTAIGKRLVNIFDNLFVHGTINANQYNICTTDGSCTTLTGGGDSFWGITTNSSYFVPGTKVLANKSLPEVERLQITGQSVFTDTAKFAGQAWFSDDAVVGKQLTFGFGSANYNPSKINEPKVIPPSPGGVTALDIYGPQWQAGKRKVRIFDNLDIGGNLAIPDQNQINFGPVQDTNGDDPVSKSGYLGIKKDAYGSNDSLNITGLDLTGQNTWNLVTIDSVLATGDLCDLFSNGGCKSVKEILDSVLPKSPQPNLVLVAKDTNGGVEWRATSTLGIVSGGDSNWTKTGNDISNSNTGKVNIIGATTIKPDTTWNSGDQAFLYLGANDHYIKGSYTGNDEFRGYNGIDLSTKSGSKVSILDSGNVGIGTNNPTKNLEVVKNQAGTTGIQVANGDTSSAPVVAQVGAGNSSAEGDSLRIITTGPNFIPSPGEGDPAFSPDTAILRAGGNIAGGLVVSSANGCKDGVSSSCGSKAGVIRFDTRDDDGTVRSSVFSKGGSLGIKTADPQTALDVNGYATVRQGLNVLGTLGVNNFLLANGAGAGKVLVSDANGLASWSDPTSVGNTYTAANLGGLQLINNNQFGIAKDGVTTVRILDGNVTANKIATSSIDSSKIVDGSIASVDIARYGIGYDRLTPSSATTGQVLGFNGANGWGPVTLPTTTYTAAPTGGLSVTNNAFSIQNLGVTNAMLANASVGTNKIMTDGVQTPNIQNGAVTGLKLGTMGATAIGQVLKWGGNTVGWVASSSSSGLTLPAGTASSQTLRYNNGVGWESTNMLMTDSNRVSIGYTTPPPLDVNSPKLYVQRGIKTGFIQVSDNAANSGGRVLVGDAGNTGIAYWGAPVGTTRFVRNGTSFTRQPGDTASANVVVDQDDPFFGGARDFVRLQCVAGQQAISGGAICERGKSLTANAQRYDAPGEWRISCGDAISDIQSVSVTCAVAN